MWRTIKKYYIIAVFLYFLILTLFFTRPLASNLTTHTVGGYGDNLYFMWVIGWTKKAVFDFGQLPHRSLLLNHPYGYNLATTEISPLQILIALPFTLVTNNPVFGFNIAMLSTYILSGMTMFYWVYKKTNSFGASIVSSTAFAFLPYHSVHFLSGHLNISAIQWLPLYFMGLIQILNTKQFLWKNVILFSFSVVCIAFTSQYYLYMSLFISFVLILILFFKKEYRNNRVLWKQLIISGCITLPFLILAIAPYYLVHRGSDSIRPLEDVMKYSAGVTDYLLPFTKSIWAGNWVSDNFPRALWNEATLYIGISVISFAAYGVIKIKDVKIKKNVKLMIIITLIAFILSLGTNLTWMEEPVVLKTPGWLNGIHKKDTFYIFLPGYLLFKYFPFYNIMRAWMRFGVIVMTMMCALAGFGVWEFLKRMKSTAKELAIIILTGMVILDFMNTPYNIVEVKPRKVDSWLADQAFGGQIQLPFIESYDQSTIYYTLFNNKPLIGQVSTFPTHRYFQLEPIFRNFPDQASVSAMEIEQIRYVILNEGFYNVNEQFIDNCRNLGLNYEDSFKGLSVFIID